ncbi:hypothetical protein [Streptomyces sp. NPDC006997]|uniref:hypothetical protein n=1 Tax=Streptomyces sp. NPDC006997 TaxID=3155356 RepID=UPI003406AED7
MPSETATTSVPPFSDRPGQVPVPARCSTREYDSHGRVPDRVSRAATRPLSLATDTVRPRRSTTRVASGSRVVVRVCQSRSPVSGGTAVTRPVEVMEDRVPCASTGSPR